MATAFQRQVVYGGALDTILLEMREIQEPQLIPYLSLAAKLRPAGPDETTATTQAIERCPESVALPHRVVPISLNDNSLVVLVCDPVRIETLEALANTLNLTIHPRVVPEYRFHLVFAATFGTEVDGRFATLADQGVPQTKDVSRKVAKVAGAKTDLIFEITPSSVRAAGKKAAKRPKRAKTKPPVAAKAPAATTSAGKNTAQKGAKPAKAGKPATKSAGTPVAKPEKSATKAASKPAAKPAKSESKAKTASVRANSISDGDPSPISPKQALKILEKAQDRDQIFSIVLRAFRSDASYAGLLTVQKGALVGRAGISKDAFDPNIANVRIPLDTESPFAQAVESAAPYIGPIASTQVIDDMVQQMGGVLPSSAALIPIVLRNRVVALCVAHQGKKGIKIDAVSLLFPVANAAAEALSRMIKQAKSPKKKRSGTSTS